MAKNLTDEIRIGYQPPYTPLTVPLTRREKYGAKDPGELGMKAIGMAREAGWMNNPDRKPSQPRPIQPASITDWNYPRKAKKPPLLSDAEKPAWLKDQAPAAQSAPAVNQPAISAPAVPAAAVAPPAPDAGFMNRINAAVPAAEKKFGFNMSTGQLAPSSTGDVGSSVTPGAPGAPGTPGAQFVASLTRHGWHVGAPGAPGTPGAQAAKFASGMQSITDYNKRMAPAPRPKSSTPFGMGMNGEAPALSKPFGTGMNGEVPMLAKPEPSKPTALTEPPASPYEQRMKSLLEGDTAGLSQSEPPPTPAQDPFMARLESMLKGSYIKQAGRRGARRGATIKGGQYHGKLLSDVMGQMQGMQ